MAIHTCKWCGKRYEPSHTRGVRESYNYCSVRCENKAKSEQQKERQRQDKETEEFLRRIGGGNAGCGELIMIAVVGIVVLFVLLYKSCNGEKTMKQQKVVATQSSMEEKTNKQVMVINDKKEVLSEHGMMNYVVIDATELRIRLQPSLDSETLKWKDGTNRHPKKGERFKYLGETNEFYNIDFNGKSVWVSKQYSYVESGGGKE